MKKVTDRAKVWLKKENLEKILEAAGRGCSIAELAKMMKIAPITLYKWRKAYPKINEAIELGREQSIEIVENTLFKKAVEGNPTCIIFFLKNKRPDIWKDRMENKNFNVEKIELEF